MERAAKLQWKTEDRFAEGRWALEWAAWRKRQQETETDRQREREREAESMAAVSRYAGLLASAEVAATGRLGQLSPATDHST